MDDVDAVSRSLYVGIDLGWTTGGTGLAAVDQTGCLVASGCVRSDDEIDGWLAGQSGRVAVAAVDAPLIVPNETGQRLPERLIGQAFGGFGASAHTSNWGRFPQGETRALRLAQRHGWAIDPETSAGGEVCVCIEVYPHPALIGLFQLPYRLDYKKGNELRRSPGFQLFMQHLESVTELNVLGSPRWNQLKSIVSSQRPGDLNRVEDELDAIVCAHLAWLWHHRRDTLHVYGDVEHGYIVAPHAPQHRPQRPQPLGVDPEPFAVEGPVASSPEIFGRRVHGRPTGYGGKAHEQRWKAAVRSAFVDCVLPADCRVQVECEFLLAPEQRGRNEPDLDNLIKTTIDALDEVLGLRSGTGQRVEADDVRVNRIAASKRFAAAGEQSGARIVVQEL